MVVGKEGLWDRKQSKKGKGGEICMILGGVRSMTVSLCHSFVIPVVLHWPKVINNSSNLFTLIATETSQSLSFFICWDSWHGANDHSVDTRQLLVLQIANIIAELFIYCFCQCWKVNVLFFIRKTVRATLIPEKVSDLQCTVICLVSKKLSCNIILKLLTKTSIQLEAPAPSAKENSVTWNHLLEKVANLPMRCSLIPWVK